MESKPQTIEISPPAGGGAAKARIFLSRSSADRAIARALIPELQALGYEVWAQDNDILTGDDFRRFMDRALRECACTVALLSKDYLASPWCRDEAVSAHRNANHRLVPLIIEEGCLPDGLIASFVYLDVAVQLTGSPAAVAKLVDQVITSGRPLEDAPAAKDYLLQSRYVANIPFDDAAVLVGRDTETGQIEAALRRSNSGAVALSGMSGVGKSWLARVFAMRNRTTWRGVWIVRADSEAEIIEDLAALGAALDPQIAALSDRAAAATATLDLIARTPGRPLLIIFDNAETPDDIRRWRPRAGAHLIITSRWSDWTGWGAASVPLDILSGEAAAKLLCDLAPRTSAADAAVIAERLGRLPLALSHAGAVLRRSSLTAAQYLRDLDRRLATLPPSSGDYPDAVRAALESNLDQLAAYSADAPALLGMASMLAPDAIPLELWETAPARAILPAALHDEVALREAFGALETYSLARMDWHAPLGPTFSLHRLVQQIVRARLAERGDQQKIIVAAIEAIHTLMPDEVDFACWPTLNRFNAHAVQLIARPDDDPDLAAAPHTFRLMRVVAGYLHARGQFLAAETAMRRAVAWLRTHPADDPDHLLSGLLSFSVVLGQIRKNAEARELVHEAVAHLEKRSPAASEDMAKALGRLWELADSHEEAEGYARRALAIAEQVHGKEDIATARYLSALAKSLGKLKHRAEAEEVIQRALKIHAKLPPSVDHAEALVVYCDLLELEDPRGLELCQQAVAVYAASPQPNDPSSGIVWGMLASKLDRAGRLEESIAAFRKAVAIYETSYGPNFFDIPPMLFALGYVFAKAERYREAADAAIDALSRKPELGLLGWEDSIHGWLAMMLFECEDYAAAIEPMLKQVAWDEANHGPTSRQVIRDIRALANIYQGAGRLTDCLATHRRILAVLEATLPADAPEIPTAHAAIEFIEAEIARPAADPTVH